MRSEAAILDVVSPMNVHAFWALGSRTDAVAPVIVVSKAATRPAQNRNSQLFEIFHRLFSISVDVWNMRRWVSALLTEPLWIVVCLRPSSGPGELSGNEIGR